VEAHLNVRVYSAICLSLLVLSTIHSCSIWMAAVSASVPYPPFVTVTTDRSRYGWGRDVSVTVTVCNPSPDPHIFHIRGGPYPDPRFDFAVYNSADQEVWRHSRHVPMTLTYLDYTLAPGESVKFPPPGLPQEGVWAQLNDYGGGIQAHQDPVGSGQYYIIGEFGQGSEKIISDRAYFVIRDGPGRPGGRYTSEYMLGTILPVIVFVEARRPGDHALAEDCWTVENMQKWVEITQNGDNFWESSRPTTYEEKVKFLYPYLKKFAIDLEPGELSPIECKIRPEGEENEAGSLNRETVEGWLTDFVESVGLGEGSVEDRIYAFLNDKLKQYPHFPDLPLYPVDPNYPSADWGFVIFVVDDRQYVQPDGGFGGTGEVARAALGGPWIIVTASCASAKNAYPPEFRAALVAHEIGHVFWALDEYIGSHNGNMRSGYFNTLNSNHADRYGGNLNDPNTWFNGPPDNPPGIMKIPLQPESLTKQLAGEKMYTSHATENTAGKTTFEVQETIEDDTPAAGVIWIFKTATSVWWEHTYTSWSGKIFSGLSPALQLNYDGTDKCYIPIYSPYWMDFIQQGPYNGVPRGYISQDGYKISCYEYGFARDEWDPKNQWARDGELEPGPWAERIGAQYSSMTLYYYGGASGRDRGWYLKAGLGYTYRDGVGGYPNTYLFGAYVKVYGVSSDFEGGIYWKLFYSTDPLYPAIEKAHGLIPVTTTGRWERLSHTLTIGRTNEAWYGVRIEIYLTYVTRGSANFLVSFCPGVPGGEYPGVIFDGPYLNPLASLPTRQMIGWVDSDSNNIPDAVESTPDFHVNPHIPSTTVNYRLKYTGYAWMAPRYHNQNPLRPAYQRRDIMVTDIVGVQYTLDEYGVIGSATAFDGAFDNCDEDFWFQLILYLPPGVHSIGVTVSGGGVSLRPQTIDQIEVVDSDIAFTSTYSGNEEIWIKHFPTMVSPWPQLTNNPGYNNVHPAWSPDGSKIAFASIRPPHYPDWEIYVMSSDGSNVRRLTNSPGFDGDPEWLADGRIAFSSCRDNNHEIYIMNSDGTGQTRLTNSPGIDKHPTTSPRPIPYPTGQYQIAFESDRSGHSEIWVMNADGTNQRQLTGNHNNEEPDWSPMGDKIAFVRFVYIEPEGLPGRLQYDIWVMNVDGTDLRPLTQSVEWEQNPEWSPDASLIAYYSATTFGDYRLMVMNADGSDPFYPIAGGQWGFLSSDPAWYPRNICPVPIVFHAHTELWLTWYDFQNAQIDNIHFTNPSESLADITVFIASVKVDAFTLEACQSTYKNYPGVCNGPVHIVSTQPILASERIVGWDSFKEASSLPGDKASREIYYTWYDMASPGAMWDAIHFINPSSTQTAHVNIFIAGELKASISIDPGDATYETYPGVIGGPVRIISDIPIFSTQRVVGWSDFQEIAGIPSWYAFKEQWFTWYDMASPGADWDAIHFINPTGSTASIEVYIAGQLKSTIALSPGEASYIYYPGVIGGPVRVVSDQPIMVTRRILGWNGFKELSGTPSELMSTKWHFEWYDMRSATWDAIHFINPSTTETAHINVYIAGELMSALTLNPGEASCVTYPGVMNGPVLITSDIPVMATQRILGWSSFEETIGIQWT